MTLATAATRPAFAHASEAELARILDYYQVGWVYEPDTFPIGWNLDGDVVESFSPDFFLPDWDLYVELTTLKQKLVRKKNRKLRRLRELYPDIRIKLFYARDFRMLLLKFGRLALVDELSGTIGQATPPRPADLIVDEAGEHAGLELPQPMRSLVEARIAGMDGITRVDDEAEDGAGATDADATTPPADGQTRASIRNRGRRARRRRREAEAAALAGATTETFL